MKEEQISHQVMAAGFAQIESTSRNPNPTLYLLPQDCRNITSKTQSREGPSRKTKLYIENKNDDNTQVKCNRLHLGVRKILSSPTPPSASAAAISSDELYPAMQYVHLTRESGVRIPTGVESTKTFKEIFDYLLLKSFIMMYWEEPEKATENSSKTVSSLQAHINAIIASPVYSELISLTFKGRPNWTKSFQ